MQLTILNLSRTKVFTSLYFTWRHKLTAAELYWFLGQRLLIGINLRFSILKLGQEEVEGNKPRIPLYVVETVWTFKLKEGAE